MGFRLTLLFLSFLLSFPSQQFLFRDAENLPHGILEPFGFGLARHWRGRQWFHGDSIATFGRKGNRFTDVLIQFTS